MKFKKIYVEITNICNLNCHFCSKDNRLLKELSLQEFDIVLRKIRHYTKCIYLHVKGEPLMHSKFIKILELTRKYGIDVKITTNGTLLFKYLTDLQKFTNIRQINVSLHCENNLKDYFDKVFKSCDILALKFPIVYRIWLLNELKLDSLSMKIVKEISNHYKLNEDFFKKVLITKNIKIKDNIYLDKDNEFIWPDNIEYSNLINGTCLGTRSHIAILVNGDVVPCCLDSKGLLKLGNIFVDDLDTILNSQLFKQINQGFRNNQVICNLCKNCNYRISKWTNCK